MIDDQVPVDVGGYVSSNPDQNADEETSGIGRRRLVAREDPRPAYRKRRAELLSAAAVVFREKGFRDTSINDIAERGGTDRATLYYYFATKQEIFDEVVSSVISDSMAYAESVRESNHPPDVKLRLVMTNLMHSCEENYPYAYVYLQENYSTVAGSMAAEYGQRYSAAVKAIIQEGMDDGCFASTSSSSVVAAGVIGMINWSHHWFKPGGKQSGEQIGQAFADLVLRGLVVDAAGSRSAT
jgi:AcrR family transcriptional regulator